MHRHLWGSHGGGQRHRAAPEPCGAQSQAGHLDRAQSQGKPCRPSGTAHFHLQTPAETERRNGRRSRITLGSSAGVSAELLCSGSAGVAAADLSNPNTALGWKSCDLQSWSCCALGRVREHLTLLCSTSTGAWFC